MALGLAAAPDAQALDYTWDPTYTAGTLAGIIDFIGNAFPGTSVAGIYNSGPPQSISVSVPDVPLVGSVNLNLNLDYLPGGSGGVYGGSAYLYNTLGGIPQPTCSGSYASNCRYALMLGTSGATLDLAEAYRAQVQSVTTGDTPAGFIPFEAAPNSTPARPTQTNQGLVFLQNPLRPNGGILSRFPGLTNAIGLDPTMPAAGKYTSADGRVAVNTTTVDATWAYDPVGDFPAVFNLFALTNSLLATLPLNLIGGLSGYVLANSAGQEATITDLGLNLAALLQLGGLPLIGTLPMTDGVSYYATLVPNQLPILAPLRLPAQGINAVLGALNSPFLLGNPLADALEPALKILVNIAYDDVVAGGAYDRTFLKSATPTPFGSVDPLTPEERMAVPGDVWNALIDGFREQLSKPFFGIIVPNTGTAEPDAAVTPAAAQPVTVKSAAAEPVAAAVSNSPAISPVSAQAAAGTPATAAEPSIPDAAAEGPDVPVTPAMVEAAPPQPATVEPMPSLAAAEKAPVAPARVTRGPGSPRTIESPQRRSASAVSVGTEGKPAAGPSRGQRSAG